MSIKDKYIQYGVQSHWALDYEKKGIPINTFKNTSIKNLVEKYGLTKDEIKIVKLCIQRQPIEEDVVNKLLQNNRFVCCLCKGQKSDAFIIHHIQEYSIGQNNTYKNLSVLCPNDHDLAHRKGISLTNKISEKQILDAKKDWEKQVKSLNNQILKKHEKKHIGNPFKELQSYSYNDKDIFFGRKQEIEDLWKKINKFNLVGLFGESGTGKTSLINAGILPKFQSENFQTFSVRCFDSPIRRIREKVQDILKSYNNISLDELLISETFNRFIICLKDILSQKEMRILLIIDQFEELFTRASESEREQFAKGINEALLSFPNGKLCFLFSIREDYIGDLWDWSHKYCLEDAWIQQYRIKRLSTERSIEIFSQPLILQKININFEFIRKIIFELEKLGNGLIYPPYLQIVCYKLFENYIEFKCNQFDDSCLQNNMTVESLIADYLSESMLYGLTEDDKKTAENILDLLTSSEGLRSLLDINYISRHTGVSNINAQLVIEHLVKKKIVHPIVENDKTIGYELVHDFLSKTFFEKLSFESRESKSVLEIFQKAFKEWIQHDVLASKDRLELLFPNIDKLKLIEKEWEFLLKSSFSIYYYWDNKWIDAINVETGKKICLSLLNDKLDRIVENAIQVLCKVKHKKAKSKIINIMIDEERSISVRDTAIIQFGYHLSDSKAIETLKKIIETNPYSKLRKSAIYSLAKNLKSLNSHYTKDNISVIYNALQDNIAHVRREAADVLGYLLRDSNSITYLISRLNIDKSVMVKKSIITTMRYFSEEHLNQITPVLMKIVHDDNEDYRVVEEAKMLLKHIED